MKVIQGRKKWKLQKKHPVFKYCHYHLPILSSKARYLFQTKPIHSCHCYSNTKYVFTIFADFAFGLSKKTYL